MYCDIEPRLLYLSGRFLSWQWRHKTISAYRFTRIFLTFIKKLSHAGEWLNIFLISSLGIICSAGFLDFKTNVS